jgi:hypothetical protein
MLMGLTGQEHLKDKMQIINDQRKMLLTLRPCFMKLFLFTLSIKRVHIIILHETYYKMSVVKIYLNMYGLVQIKRFIYFFLFRKLSFDFIF